MRVEEAKQFTLKRLFFGDMLLNWFLGAVLTLLPAAVDNLLGREPVLPLLVYRVLGGGFLAFAAWQTWIIVRRDIGPPALIFASAMAEGPVIVLTAALVFMHLPLRPIWRVGLWIGDVYMLLLGVWYAYLARLLLKEKQPQD